ncbi:MAG: CehA/McbA family metallohydrolase [Tepidisphaerales bacterium]
MRFPILLLLPFALAAGPLERLGDKPLDASGAGELVVDVVDAQGAAMAVRVVVTAADGTHPDGSGRGVYKDGRFFAEGTFKVTLPPGRTGLKLSCGPEFEPIDETVEIPAGRSVQLRAVPRRWIDLAKLGWYGGDHHVHTQHDAKATIRTDSAYTALQGRANGLSVITEADAEVTGAAAANLDTAAFLYRRAPEQRPGPFVGHINTPGITRPIGDERAEALMKRPLPALALMTAVHELDGACIRTHTFTPPHLLHWMGATEAWSDAALGMCGDLMDVDGQASEMLYFAALNLGNRVAVSSYTDCALGRLDTLSPGDRRVYAKSGKLDYPAMIAAMRMGRTFATNGGPVFAFLEVDGKEPGETIHAAAGQKLKFRGTVRSLGPLLQAQVFGPAGMMHSFDVSGRSGEVVVEHEFTAGDAPAWFILRAQDQRGNWAITSPVYIFPAGAKLPASASAVLLSIANHTRYVVLSREFFAHAIVTVRPPEGLAEVRLMKDGKPLQTWKPADGDQWANGRVPVTEIFGAYAPGWAWHKETGATCHFQADWPVTEAGWYGVTALTSTGREIRGESLRYDPANPKSHAISSARLAGPDTTLEWCGYGEEMDLSGIRQPFAGDHWWYPNNSAWRIKGVFGGNPRETGGGRQEMLSRVVHRD